MARPETGKGVKEEEEKEEKEKEKKKRGRKRKYWKFSSDPPDWLPDGWIMEVGVTQTGDTFKYYLSPVSEQKFCTKKEVLSYLIATNDDGYASEITSCSGDNGQVVIEQVENSHEWLPPGWLLEIRVLMSGANAGQKYKCYYDPFTGYRFYSKADVFHFLKSRKLSSPVSKQKRPSSGTPDNILAQIDYSPDGLPCGWIKEYKFRKPSKKGQRFRKDLPPIPIRELKSLVTTARQSLFTEEAVKAKGEVATEFDDSAEKQRTPADHVSSGS